MPRASASVMEAAMKASLRWRAAHGVLMKPVEPPKPSSGSCTVIKDGRLGLVVSLSGTLGSGKHMVIDELAWRRVSMVFGGQWGLRQLDNGGLYVVSKRKLSAGPGLPATPVLARYLARATTSQVVTYRDGDTLNLMAGNLVVMDRAEFMRALDPR